MGQYHLIVNVKKRQFLCGHRFGDGIKLLEFGSSGSGTMMGLAALLADSNGRGGGDLSSDNPIIGSWAGDPIVITGDYGDPGRGVSQKDIREIRKHMRQHGELQDEEYVPNLYHVANSLYEDVSDAVILALCDDPYERMALIERGAEAAKTWKPAAPPPPPGNPFEID